MLGPNTRDATSCAGNRSSSAITIPSLPLELLLLITESLPISAIVSLKLTSKHLHHAIAVSNAYHGKDASHALPHCEQKALRRNLNEAADLATGRRRCLLCNCLLYLRFFPNDGATCTLHDGRYMSTTLPPSLDEWTKSRLDDLAGSVKEPYWVSIKRQLCVHTGRVVHWDVPACECACDSCAHVTVLCHLRVSDSSMRPTRWCLKFSDGLGRVLEYDKELGESPFRQQPCGEASGWRAVPGEALACSRTVPVVALEVAEAIARTHTVGTPLI